MFRRFHKLMIAAIAIAFLLSGFAAEAITVTKVKGLLYSKRTTAQSVTLKKNGVLTSIPLSPNTKVVRNGVVSSLSQFVLGDHVTAIYADGSLYPIKVKAKGILTTTTSGVVQHVSSGSGLLQLASGAVQTNSHTRVVRNGKVGSLTSLALGDNVTVNIDDSDNEAEDIESEGPEEAEVHGTISMVDVNAGTVTITPSDGTPDVTVNVTTNTEIEVNGQDATISDLLVGMFAEAEYDPTTFEAFRIEAETEAEDAEVEGTITNVDVANSQLTIQPASGNAVTLSVDSSTQIEKDDQPAFLSDLQVGDNAQAEYNATTLVANQIEVETADSGDDIGLDN